MRVKFIRLPKVALCDTVSTALCPRFTNPTLTRSQASREASSVTAVRQAGETLLLEHDGHQVESKGRLLDNVVLCVRKLLTQPLANPGRAPLKLMHGRGKSRLRRLDDFDRNDAVHAIIE